MKTPAEIQRYILGLSPEDSNRLLGWIMCDLAHNRKFAALVRDFREWRESQPSSSSVSGVTIPIETQSSCCSETKMERGRGSNHHEPTPTETQKYAKYIY